MIGTFLIMLGIFIAIMTLVVAHVTHLNRSPQTEKYQLKRRVDRTERAVWRYRGRMRSIREKLKDPMTQEVEAAVLKLYLDKNQLRIEEAEQEWKEARRALHEFEIRELTEDV